MLSSLIHILIVTPVIFAWLHERKLEKTAQDAWAVGMNWSRGLRARAQRFVNHYRKRGATSTPPTSMTGARACALAYVS